MRRFAGYGATLWSSGPSVQEYSYSYVGGPTSAIAAARPTYRRAVPYSSDWDPRPRPDNTHTQVHTQ